MRKIIILIIAFQVLEGGTHNYSKYYGFKPKLVNLSREQIETIETLTNKAYFKIGIKKGSIKAMKKMFPS